MPKPCNIDHRTSNHAAISRFGALMRAEASVRPSPRKTSKDTRSRSVSPEYSRISSSESSIETLKAGNLGRSLQKQKKSGCPGCFLEDNILSLSRSVYHGTVSGASKNQIGEHTDILSESLFRAAESTMDWTPGRSASSSKNTTAGMKKI